MQDKPHTIPEATVQVGDSPGPRPPLNDNWQARRELATQLRRLNNALLTAEVPTDTLRALTAALRAQTAGIEAMPRIYGRRALIERDRDDPLQDVSAAIGYSNAMALPVDIWQQGGKVHATFTTDWSHEGPFGYVHGGVIALIFDQLLGITQHAANTGSGRTGTLTIRYHQPTPLNQPLRVVGELKRIDGRKKFIVAELWAGDVRTASCEAVFISKKAWA